MQAETEGRGLTTGRPEGRKERPEMARQQERRQERQGETNGWRELQNEKTGQQEQGEQERPE